MVSLVSLMKSVKAIEMVRAIQFSMYTEDTKDVPFREKVAQAHGTGICKALEYAAAREQQILVPLYSVPLPRYYCRKISIQGAALHKVGPQTCATPCCCIKWRLAYCGPMGLCHPF